LGTVQIIFTVQTWTIYYSETDQKLNLNLASDMAKELEPYAVDSLDMHNIEHSIHYMMVLNPKIEIYMLDDTGKILAFFADPKKKVQTEFVNLEPIKNFITEGKTFPIVGDDPRHPGIRKPFSASHLKLGGEDSGYLYVILGGELFDSAQDMIRQSYLVKTLIQSLLFTLIFTGLIGVIIFGLFTRRLRKMNEVVKSFEQGQYSERIPQVTNNEIGQLSLSFNKMADTIVANLDELKETDRMRRELIANISHDLRSPMASLRGYLETIQIKDKKLSNLERQKYIDVLLDTANGLEKLVEDLFELSKLDAKQVKAQFEPFSIKDLIFDVMTKFKPAAENKKIILDACVPDGLPQVYADIGLIERVLSNLLENSIRYTPENGSVTVNVTKSDQMVKVLVEDTGFGISQEEIPHIFERFYRVEKSRAESTGGTGLGLAIANKIMEVHESNISVDSKIDVGSTFSFDLKTWPK